MNGLGKITIEKAKLSDKCYAPKPVPLSENNIDSSSSLLKRNSHLPQNEPTY